MRYNRRERGDRISLYLDHMMRSKQVRVTAGYFVPDFGLGLVYSPLGRIYPFSSGFPIRTCRHFVRRTSFYGESLRGIAITAGTGALHLFFFGGQAGEWKDISYDPGEKILAGTRLEWMKGSTRAGLTLSGAGVTRVAGLDIVRKRKGSIAGIEISLDQDLQLSLVAGLRRKWDRSMLGLRLFGGGYGDISGFHRIVSGRPGERRGVSGFLLVLEKRLGRRCRLAVAAGENAISTGDQSSRRREYRLELRWKWRGINARTGYSVRLTDKEGLIPFPPVVEGDTSNYSNLDLLFRGRFTRMTGYRVSLRFPHGSGGRGRTGTIDLRIGGIDSATRIDLIATIYDALEGNPAMYVYEAVLRGGYPWHQYRGNGARMTILGRFSAAGSLISARLHRTSGGDGGADIQFLREF